MAVAILSPVSMRAEDEVSYTVYFEVSENDQKYGLDVKTWAKDRDVKSTTLCALLGCSSSTTKESLIKRDIDFSNYDAEGTLAENYDETSPWSLNVKVSSDSGKVYYNDEFDPAAEISTVDEDVNVTYTLTLKTDGNKKLDDRLETNVYVYVETEPGSGEYNAKAEDSFKAEIGSYLDDNKNMNSLLRMKTRDEDKNEYQLVFDTNEVTANAEVRGSWVLVDELPENRFGGKPSSKPSTPVYDELDTNHDGVVSCDEAHGEGWVWNEDKKACVYTGSTTSTVIVNTATK